MRFIILALILGFSTIADAQILRGGARGDLEDARDCLDSIDQDALRDYAEDAEDMADDAKDMCDNGDDEAARDIVLDYIDEMKNNREFKKLAECSEILRDSMPNLGTVDLPSIEDYEDELDDICDYVD
jgi:predicted component of type VI protein secretion system